MKKIVVSIVAILLIIQLTTLSFAISVTLNRTEEELIQYNKKLEQEAKEKLKTENNSNVDNQQEISTQNVEVLNSQLNKFMATAVGENINTIAEPVATPGATPSADPSAEPSEEPSTTPSAEPTPSTSPDSDITWTDFSKAQVSFSFATSYAITMKVSNIKTLSDHSYYVYISSDKNSITREDNEGLIILQKVKNEDAIESVIPNKCMALNKTFYYVLSDYYKGEEKTLSTGEIKRPELPPVGNRIDVYMYEKGSCSTSQNTYSDSSYKRKINYKIGKVNDINLLKTFKSNEREGFKQLLDYAKKNPAITEGTLNAGEMLSFNPIDNVSLEDRGYYFAYYTMDDENGKYYPLEDAQIYIETSGALCHFAFGDMKFSDDQIEDPTVSPEKLPYAGTIAVGGFALLASIVIYYVYRKNKEYDDVK